MIGFAFSLDCFAFPSRYEGLGLAVIEAQCGGLPVIASNAVPFEAKATNNIEFIDVDNVDEWVAKIRRNNNRVVKIDERFDIVLASKKLESFYDMVLGVR